MDAQARQLLDLALLNLRDYALMLMDAQGTIVGWLCGATDILGYEASEMVGQSVSRLFIPEDVEKGLDGHELEVAKSRSTSQDDRWHVRKDGTRIWISGTLTALRTESGELRGFIKVMRDRTDGRIAHEAVANRQKSLEDSIERTHRFIQTLGHELRNPLAPIKNCGAIVERAADDDPRLLRAAQTIAAQVAVLEKIASDLTDISRLQNRKLRLELSDFDIRELVHEQVEAQREQAHVGGVRLIQMLPPRALLVTADVARIRQAISNLLSNAIKYTPAGGQVWVKATQESESIVVRLDDTGIGIAPDVLPRIFDLFTQESRAQDLVPSGLGVGLAIVKQIADLHGGVVQARSSGIGKGSEFTLRLPRRGPPYEAT